MQIRNALYLLLRTDLVCNCSSCLGVIMKLIVPLEYLSYYEGTFQNFKKTTFTHKQKEMANVKLTFSA